MANGVENVGFLSWFRILFRVVGAAVPAPLLVWLCSGLFWLAPLLAEAAFPRVHDMAPSLVMKFDGEDSVVGILPEVLFGEVGDGSMSPLVQESYVPPGIALLCAQGWVSPLLCWLLVVLVCDFVFFWARHGASFPCCGRKVSSSLEFCRRDLSSRDFRSTSRALTWRKWTQTSRWKL